MGLVPMQFDVTQDFPVGLAQLWTALGRTDYVERKYRALGSTSLRLLSFSADAALIEVELERQAPVVREAVPAWARLLAGRRQAMRHHTRWRRTGPARIDVELEIAAMALPLSARGTGTVVELSPARSRMTLHFEVSGTAAALPSAVARVFAQQVRHALDADHAFTLAYLRGGADPS
jgi:hypothetical protein